MSAMSDLTVGSTFNLEVSQDGSSNWISLRPLTVLANVTGSDELDALTNAQSPTYRVSSGSAIVTAFFTIIYIMRQTGLSDDW